MIESTSESREEWIRRRAYELWEGEGRAHGRHEAHWHQACEEYEALQRANGTALTVMAGEPAGAGSAATRKRTRAKAVRK